MATLSSPSPTATHLCSPDTLYFSRSQSPLTPDRSEGLVKYTLGTFEFFLECRHMPKLTDLCICVSSAPVIGPGVKVFSSGKLKRPLELSFITISTVFFYSLLALLFARRHSSHKRESPVCLKSLLNFIPPLCLGNKDRSQIYDYSFSRIVINPC